MLPTLMFRLVSSVGARPLVKLAWAGGFKGMLSIEKFKRRLKRNQYFPPFLHFSITNSCNLRCQGCWVDVEAPEERIELETLNRCILDSKMHGNSIFGILGGEPFLHPELFEVLGAHKDCYFQVFSNGQPITEKTAADMRRLGNVTPLISVEGKERVSDERRGKKEVFSRTMRGLDHCVKAGLFTGVATSLCQSNIDELLTEEWLRELIRRGVHYVWYYAYRPVGSKPNYELALRPEQLLRMRQFIVEMRCRLPLIIIETYYDHDGRALCPMATGLSHHVSPRGEIEPCPIIQFAKENIRDRGGLFELLTQSAFLRDFRETARRVGRGCIVLERPDLIGALVERHGARDSTSRGTAVAELALAPRNFSQWLPGHEVPEKHWVYRLAKRYWFNDFAAYDGAHHDLENKASQVKMKLDQARSGPDTRRGAEVAESCNTRS